MYTTLRPEPHPFFFFMIMYKPGFCWTFILMYIYQVLFGYGIDNDAKTTKIQCCDLNFFLAFCLHLQENTFKNRNPISSQQ